MGTETTFIAITKQTPNIRIVKLNNPLMGTETFPIPPTTNIAAMVRRLN